MKAQLSSKDLIQISAYLDGELSEREKTKFEKRLQTEDNLKLALQDLHQTKQLIRKLPPKKAPYNFTITQSMAESLSNPFKQLIRVFSYTSAASFLVAIVLFFMNLTPNLMNMSAAAPMAYDTAAEIQEKAVEEAEAPEIILWSEPQAFGKGGGQEEPMPQMAAPAEEMAEDAAMPSAEMETVTALSDNAEEGVYESEAVEEESVMAESEVMQESVMAEEEAPQESEPLAGTEMMQEADAAETQAEGSAQTRDILSTPAPTLMVVQATAESFNPILGLPSSDENQQADQVTAEPTLTDTGRENKETNWFLISEISLILIAVVSAILAVWFRKKT